MSLIHYSYYKSHKINQIQEEQNIKDFRADYLKQYDDAARMIQHYWMKRQNRKKIEQIRISKEVKVQAAEKKKIEAKGKLDRTHGNTGKFLIAESRRQTQNLFDDILHLFVFKQHGFVANDEEQM